MSTTEFDAELQRLEGKIIWTVFYLPFPALEAYGTNGRVNVAVTVDGHPFSAVLLPSRSGHYVAFNQAMKAATGKSLGDTVHVTIAQDLAPREVEVPEEVHAALIANGNARAAFEALPAYIQREEIRRIQDAKTEPTRCKRLTALMQKLSGKTTQ